MTKFAVVKTGGKQYLVREGDEIVVDRIKNVKEKERVSLDKLAKFNEDGSELEIGSPFLKEKVEAQVLSHSKGKKIKILRFKAKVRYRRRKGFRPLLTTLKILKI